MTIYLLYRIPKSVYDVRWVFVSAHRTREGAESKQTDARYLYQIEEVPLQS